MCLRASLVSDISGFVCFSTVLVFSVASRVLNLWCYSLTLRKSTKPHSFGALCRFGFSRIFGAFGTLCSVRCFVGLRTRLFQSIAGSGVFGYPYRCTT